MSFPEKTWWGKNKGWKNLGRVCPANGRIDSCSYCKKDSYIGKENGTFFKYCSRCLVKLYPPTNYQVTKRLI